MKNAERRLVSSLRRYAVQRGFRLQLLAGDWVAVLEDGKRRQMIMGYDLGLNDSAAARIANDKGATFEVLQAEGITALEHRVFLHPRFLDFTPGAGNWPGLLAAFASFNCDAVIKDNEGTGGVEVFRARSSIQLEQLSHQLFQISRSIALSPFVAIDDETRFVILDGECVLAYSKERPFVTGDGKRTFRELMVTSPAAADASEISPETVPAPGERVPIQWKHNLGSGARAVQVDPLEPSVQASLTLALRAFGSLGLRFASIDIIRVDGKPMVLEVNSGVMIEVAGKPDFGGEPLVDRIYHRALDLAWSTPARHP